MIKIATVRLWPRVYEATAQTITLTLMPYLAPLDP